MRINRAPGFVAALLLAGCAHKPPVSASAVLAEIHSDGARQVISKYIDRPEWEQILRGIGTAEDEWLQVYVELRKQSDGHAGESLSAVLFDVALPVEPYKVFSIEPFVGCEFTFEADCPPDGIERYLSRLESSLKSASTPEQTRIREVCLEGIAKTRLAFPDPKAYCAQ